MRIVVNNVFPLQAPVSRTPKGKKSKGRRRKGRGSRGSEQGESSTSDGHEAVREKQNEPVESEPIDKNAEAETTKGDEAESFFKKMEVTEDQPKDTPPPKEKGKEDADEKPVETEERMAEKSKQIYSTNLTNEEIVERMSDLRIDREVPDIGEEKKSSKRDVTPTRKVERLNRSQDEPSDEQAKVMDRLSGAVERQKVRNISVTVHDTSNFGPLFLHLN